MSASARKPALGFICVTMVLLMFGYGLIIPVLPNLVTQFEGGSIAAGSRSYGNLIGIFALMQFVCSPILGALSDQFGRRRVLLITLTGLSIDYVIMGASRSIAWLYVGRMISGATAGAIATCNAYIADIMPPEKRAQGYGLLNAAFGLGFVIGPVPGGLLGEANLRLPFFVAAGCVLLNLVYGAAVLPESLPVERRRPFQWKRANAVGGLLALRRFRGVLPLASALFITTFASSMLQAIWVLYTGYRFGWSTAQVGTSLAMVGISMAIVQSVLVKPIIARTGERRALILGLGISAIEMTAYGSISQGWMMYLVIVFGSLGGIAGPAAQALMTRQVAADEQGKLQGAVSSLYSLAYIFAPLLASWSFGACIAPAAKFRIPGIAFYEAALLIAVAIPLCWRATRHAREVASPAAA